MDIKRLERTDKSSYQSLTASNQMRQFGKIGVVTVWAPIRIVYSHPPFFRCVDGECEIITPHGAMVLDTGECGVFPAGLTTFKSIRPPSTVISAMAKQDEIGERRLVYQALHPNEICQPLMVDPLKRSLGTVSQPWVWFGLPSEHSYEVVTIDRILPRFVVQNPTIIIVTRGRAVVKMVKPHRVDSITAIIAYTGMPIAVRCGRNGAILDVISVTETEHRRFRWSTI